MQFYKGQDLLASYFADIIDIDALIAKKKEFIESRLLNWIDLLLYVRTSVLSSHYSTT